MSEFKHYSVLLHETVDGLNIRPDGIYVDGTLGGGGHAHEVCTHLSPAGRLIGIDQDKDAIQAASERLSDVRDRVTIVRSNYERIDDVLKELGIGKVDGIYLDLGVSSYQIPRSVASATGAMHRSICGWMTGIRSPLPIS